MEEKYIYLFLDLIKFSDKLLSDKESQVTFFQSLDSLEKRFNSKLLVFLTSQKSVGQTHKSFSNLITLFSAYDKKDSLVCAVCEYSGFLIQDNKLYKLIEMESELQEKRKALDVLAREYDGELDGEIKSYYSFWFSSISNEKMRAFESEVDVVLNNQSQNVRAVASHESGGVLYNILPNKNKKLAAVKFLYKRFSENFSPLLVLMQGENYSEDYSMFDLFKSFLNEQNITAFFLALNVAELTNDRYIIKENRADIKGLVNAINRVVEL